jgi:hypothetical protein
MELCGRVTTREARMTGNGRTRPEEPDDGALTEVSRSTRMTKKATFLAAYARCGNLTEAAAEAGITRHAHNAWLRDDDLYRRGFAAACQEASDALEAEARRRALHGVEEDVYHQGRVVGTRRVYSDALLMFLLSRAPLSDGHPAGGGSRMAPPDVQLHAEINELLKRRPANGHHG